ncbi:MAG: dihydroorotate dehydrogenase [Bradymonadales bacterium]|nr:dihydroorotate dehydrogenase [Bradymonadales bacterium]
MPSLAVRLGLLRLESPLVLASGILGVSASSLALVASRGAGAVTTKSCGLDPRAGHPGPTVLPVTEGLLNAVGLSNPGADAMCEEIREFKSRCPTTLLFASLFGRTVEEFGEVAAHLAAAEPDLLEVNVSCPNVSSELGLPFEAKSKELAAITALVKKKAGDIPVALKLSINWGPIGEQARICAENGADLITAINTVGPGMLIDTNVMRPVLSNQVGGLSGPCILPLAVRAIWEVRRSVDLPIIGLGGVASSEDALQLIMAGATAVGIGTAVYHQGLDLFERVNQGLLRFLAEKGLEDLSEVCGAAHG